MNKLQAEKDPVEVSHSCRVHDSECRQSASLGPTRGLPADESRADAEELSRTRFGLFLRSFSFFFLPPVTPFLCISPTPDAHSKEGIHTGKPGA